jgi:hypothetical protein
MKVTLIQSVRIELGPDEAKELTTLLGKAEDTTPAMYELYDTLCDCVGEGEAL